VLDTVLRLMWPTAATVAFVAMLVALAVYL
jgi:hypothetical protein